MRCITGPEWTGQAGNGRPFVHVWMGEVKRGFIFDGGEDGVIPTALKPGWAFHPMEKQVVGCIPHLTASKAMQWVVAPSQIFTQRASGQCNIRS